LIAGREFSGAEHSGNASVAILNERGARSLFPELLPVEVVGRRVDTARGQRVVIGIARDVPPKTALVAEPGMFLPLDDLATPDNSRTKQAMQAIRLVVRLHPGAWLDVPALKRRLDARLGGDYSDLVLAYSVERQVLPHLAQLRFMAALLGALAVGTLVVSASGVFAATTAALAFRRREFAVRVALGATARHVVVLLTRAEGRTTAAGIIAGGLLSFWLGGLIDSLLAGTESRPWSTWISTAVLLGATAMLATILPVARVIRRQDLAATLRS
jgi:hypothetical protein